MKTEDLVTMLATGVEPIVPHAVGKRYAIALSLGLVGAMILMLALLGLRPDLAEAAHLPMFWVKIAYAGSLAWSALAIANRLGRPGVQLNWLPAALIVPIIGIWIFGAIALAEAAPLERVDLIFGATWSRCPWLIATLAVPTFVAAFWVMRDLAPTRPHLAGAASGLLAGALGALVYCLHCPEMAAPFLGIWYLLGMLLPALAGGLLGRQLLRW